MWVSCFSLILLVGFGESTVYDWGSPSPRRQRPISDDEWGDMHQAMNEVSAKYGSQRPQYADDYNTNTLSVPKLGAASKQDFHRQMSNILSRYPGAIYSTVGPDGKIITGRVGEENPNPSYAADGPSSNYGYTSPEKNDNYRPPPQTQLRSPLQSRPPPNQPSPPGRFSSPLRYNQPDPAVASSRRNTGINQGERQSNDLSSPRPEVQSNSYSSPRPQPQRDDFRQQPLSQPQRDDFRQQPPPTPSRDPRLDTQASPAGDNYPQENGGEHDDNPLGSFLGNGQGLRRGGAAQVHDDEDNGEVLGGLFGGGGRQEKAAPKPVSTFDPKDGGQAAENLASAISGALDYHWKTQRKLDGNVPFYLDLCEKAVSNQEPAIKEMKRSDRTLMDVMPVWRKALENQLSNFFINVVGDRSYTVGGEQIEQMMTLMQECVRPKLVLAKV